MLSLEHSTPRAVFLDFDGTYAHHAHVPEQHEAVVRQARAAGHVVMLCTGRPRSMVPAGVLDAFDGLIGSAGSYVEIAGQVLQDLRFPPSVATRTIDHLNGQGAAYLLEAPEAAYGLPGIDQRIEELVGKQLGPMGADQHHDNPAELGALRIQDDLSTVRFSKVTCFHSPIPVQELVTQIGPGAALLPLSLEGMEISSAGEIYQPGVHKAAGIAVAIEHLGIDQQQVIAMGDGANDIEMLEFAGHGVAIEGSRPELLALADSVAAGPAQAGLVAAFDSLGLLA